MSARGRALAKATTWRVLATGITAGCAWLVTGEVLFAASIGALDTCVKLGGYYLHERLWDRMELGGAETPYGHTFLTSRWGIRRGNR
jgi:uncharacterized membrane protein